MRVASWCGLRWRTRLLWGRSQLPLLDSMLTSRFPRPFLPPPSSSCRRRQRSACLLTNRFSTYTGQHAGSDGEILQAHRVRDERTGERESGGNHVHGVVPSPAYIITAHHWRVPPLDPFPAANLRYSIRGRGAQPFHKYWDGVGRGQVSKTGFESSSHSLATVVAGYAEPETLGNGEGFPSRACSRASSARRLYLYRADPLQPPPLQPDPRPCQCAVVP